MSNNGPSISIEEFELKYPKILKDRFDVICRLMTSGDKVNAGRLYKELAPEEALLFKQYPNDLKVYNAIQRSHLDQKIDQIDHRLAVMKEEKREVLSQYHQDTAQGMRHFQADTSQHAETKKKAGKKHSCTIL